MSDIVNKAVEQLSEKIGTFSSSAKFVIEDEGSIIIDENGVREGDEPTDVTLTANRDVFEGILDGSLNATAAYMSGKLQLDGDMSVAMQLGQALS